MISTTDVRRFNRSDMTEYYRYEGQNEMGVSQLNNRHEQPERGELYARVARLAEKPLYRSELKIGPLQPQKDRVTDPVHGLHHHHHPNHHPILAYTFGLASPLPPPPFFL